MEVVDAYGNGKIDYKEYSDFAQRRMAKKDALDPLNYARAGRLLGGHETPQSVERTAGYGFTLRSRACSVEQG